MTAVAETIEHLEEISAHLRNEATAMEHDTRLASRGKGPALVCHGAGWGCRKCRKLALADQADKHARWLRDVYYGEAAPF